MIKKVIAAIVLIALFTVAIVQAMDKPTEEKLTDSTKSTGISIGVKAPDFELKQLDGKSVKLSDLKGKKVILNFWATWCPPCEAEMPAMQKYYDESPKDVVILAINIDPQLDVQGFIDKKGITFPIPLDAEDEVNSLYQVISIPTTYFIDSDGIIKYKHIGAMTYDLMKNNVNNMN
jgi:peroxiredoxin